MSYAPIQALFDGPVDIVGDIHGEIGALEKLLARLGYRGDGVHPDGRRLVFVGDLVDRGEDSPAVVRRVDGLMAAGLAQCVLGNHELNLLLESRKEGNGWFFPPEADHDHARGHFLCVPRADAAEREWLLAWFAKLPLALERADLRVVHACWHPPAIAVLRGERRGVRELYEAWVEQLDAQFHAEGLQQRAEQETRQWQAPLNDPQAEVPLLPATAAMNTRRQSGHPVRALTSGLERATSQPFWGAGKWRMNERVAWWNDYDDVVPVVFGHYWRWPGDEAEATARSRGPNLFAGSAAFDWLGKRGTAMCVDYCAGLRWRERAAGVERHLGVAAALRWPERQVVLSE